MNDDEDSNTKKPLHTNDETIARFEAISNTAIENILLLAELYNLCETCLMNAVFAFIAGDIFKGADDEGRRAFIALARGIADTSEKHLHSRKKETAH